MAFIIVMEAMVDEFSFCIMQKQTTIAYLYWALKHILDVYFPSYFSTFFYIYFKYTLYAASLFACVTTIFLICNMLRNVLIIIRNFAIDDIDLSQKANKTHLCHLLSIYGEVEKISAEKVITKVSAFCEFRE